MDLEHYLLIVFDDCHQHVATEAGLWTEREMQDYADDQLAQTEDAAIVLVWIIDGDAFIERQAPPAYSTKLPWVE